MKKAYPSVTPYLEVRFAVVPIDYAVCLVIVL